MCPVIVGHVPITEGTDFSAAFKSTKRKASPLKQGGLEISIHMELKWANEKGITVLKNHVESVSYPVFFLPAHTCHKQDISDTKF